VDLRRVFEHTTYAVNRRLLAYTVAIIVVSVITSFMLLFPGYGVSVDTWISGQLIIVSIIFKILIALQISRIAREIASGEIQLYLAHTLTRSEYLLSMLLASWFTSTVILVSSYLVTFSITAPNLITSGDILKPLTYLVPDLLFIALITLFFASRGREGIASAIGTVLPILLPLALAITFYIYASHPAHTQMFYVFTVVLGLMNPYIYNLLYTNYQNNPYTSHGLSRLPHPSINTLASITLSIAIIVITFILFKKKDL
jgi:ABC-type transport system involved in multi-copper enzyme maturation permease subunit